jgi:MADS-box transcription factor
MVPPHIQNQHQHQHQPAFQNINHAPSASPPIPNGVGFDPRHGTPQPQGVSRPSSRNHIRRASSNLNPHPHPSHATPPPPGQNGFAYMPNPSIYNPNANPNLSQQAPRPQYSQFGHPHPAPPSHHPHPAQSMPQHHQPPPSHHLPQQGPHHNLSQPPHQQMPQSYMQDQGRHSMPPAFPPEQQPQQPPPQQRPIALPNPTVSQQNHNLIKSEGSQSPRPPVSKHSIFTPIDDQGSMLARHFGVGPSLRESPQREAPVKQEPPQVNTASQSVPIPSASHPPMPPQQPARSATDPQRAPSTSSIPDIAPPPRASSVQVNAKRPRLKVQIPSEQSDGGSATADSSPRDSAGNRTATPARVTSDGNHTGVVLPPPSPSAGPLLSAGAQGPPNPFARPPPPGTNSQNGTSYGSSNNMDTPISALPSRFVSDALLPSPSSFFPEWGFGRSGPDSNMLPSPLTFPTPSVQAGPGFAREDELDKKRKSPDSGIAADGPGKKLKT